jgi:hypothetical protein
LSEFEGISFLEGHDNQELEQLFSLLNILTFQASRGWDDKITLMNDKGQN